MTNLTKKLTFIGLGLIPVILIGVAKASDHADTPDIAANPGSDLTDVYIFPSPTNPDNVVLAMNVHPLIGPGQGPAASFDPNILYQFKIDTNGDGFEDKVIQAKFTGTGTSQTVQIAGPISPSSPGTTSRFETPNFTKGRINTTFFPTPGMNVFCGAREDSFFFDLDQFFKIFPDRATPLTGTPVSDPNTPKDTGWRAPGAAVDFLSAGQYNVLSIVIELPRKSLL
ncbi:MAG: DUF4331 domain-containing protein [Armatimonadetes bacterium]|nr:DUF4331 domain-containing protein [Armatimonadota bacterium]